MNGDEFVNALREYVRNAIMYYRPSCEDDIFRPNEEIERMQAAAEKMKEIIDGKPLSL